MSVINIDRILIDSNSKVGEMVMNGVISETNEKNMLCNNILLKHIIYYKQEVIFYDMPF